MPNPFKLVLLLMLVAMGTAACSGQSEPTDQPASPSAVAASDEPLLVLDTTGRALSVTHRPTAKTHLLFEDETVEDSEEGTFYHLLSRFGPYVSYRMTWYYEGGAHPSYGTTYTAVTVGETVEAADLRHLFSEDVLYVALQQTDLVQQTDLRHTTLAELLDGLATTYECEMSFERFFSSFFVEEVKEGIAQVVVGLTHGCEVQRGAFTRLTLKMTVPEDKKGLFDDLHVFYHE